MNLKHTAPFPADYPTLGLRDVQPGGVVELVGDAAQNALNSGSFERAAAPKPRTRNRTAKPKPAADKTTPVPGTKEGE